MTPTLVPVGMLAAFAVAAAQAGAPQQVVGGMNVDPAEVPAGMFYSGATVHVSAVVPMGTAVAMVCAGTSHPLELKKKGKALGVIWMNVADVSFGEVPDLYLLHTSAPLDELAAPGTLRDLEVGYDALEARSEPGPGAEALFGELTRLKRRDGLWVEREGAITLQPAADGMALATTDFVLPAKAPPGTYRVLVYTFRDNAGVMVGEGQVQVRQVGLAGFIATLSSERGLLYGVLAALVAVV
ncbi:MAG: TIGR02186 family protein, partial [Gemmatimonadota bacterium]